MSFQVFANADFSIRGEEMFGLGLQELLILLVIVVILFGATRLPALGRSFGEAIRNFKKSTSGPEEIESTPGVAAGEKDQASGT
ncbi:MAG: twin-arginine translocase TatA/TatE family subunit [Candidatus Sulfobium sp.]|jgi:sec-independent protein translocase protein TatA